MGDASGASNISSMVKQAIKGKKDDGSKADKAMVDHLTYSSYSSK